MSTTIASLPLRRLWAALTSICLLAALQSPGPAAANHEPAHDVSDQGLTDEGEEQAFARALPLLLGNDNVDSVLTMRTAAEPRDGCTKEALVYWVYSERGTICFTRTAAGTGWDFDVELLEGINPFAEQDHTALATVGEERAASSVTVGAVPNLRNLVDADEQTYPFMYERIVAEFDSPRTGDFIIMPDNTADRGGPGAHGHGSVTQSRSTFLISGRGARRSPLEPEAEAALGIQHPDIAPTVAEALGINSYFDDTGDSARVQNGTPSSTALLKRQDGDVLEELLEPKFNTFVVVVDGLRPEDVTQVLMPNLTSLVAAECTAPGDDCATSYEQARSIMVSETNSNHVAMMSGAYAADSGIVANESFDRGSDTGINTDQPALNFAETLFDAIESQKPWLTTALVMGKTKLRELFDCTRTTEGDCGPSSANPEGVAVDHLSPDFIAGAFDDADPAFDPDRDCPAEPGTGSGYTNNSCVMDKTLDLLNEEDPDFTFVHFPLVDAFSHLFGAGSPQALGAVTDADVQIGRLIDRLKATGRWQHSTVIVTADHNFGDTISPANTIFTDGLFAGAGPSPFEVVTHGGSASVFLSDLGATDTPTTAQQLTLKELRSRALLAPGVEEALYRLPNPEDDSSSFTIDTVHPDWDLGGTDRVGELLLVGDEQHTFAEQTSSDNLILGEHGHPTDRHIPFVVASGGTYVEDQSVAPSNPNAVDQGDDTALLPEQAENVDIAPTIAWILGIDAPGSNEGRVLDEAFIKHPLDAQSDGDITEPIANRAAIFIFDANNSVELHCLMDSSTCGDPIPVEATDPATVANLTGLAQDGTFTTYGSTAAWPSVTFPNHNVVGSGAYPGHHGIVNNRFYVRETKKFEEPINSSSTEHPLFTFSSALLSADIETLHEAVHRSYGDWEETDGPQGDAYTASVNEPSARGADYATLEPDQSFPNPAQYIATANPTDLAADTTQSCAQDQGYLTESTLDHIGQTQARRLFEDSAEHPLPKYFINNFTLTDGAGHHYGPHTQCTIAAYRDSDRRLGRILDAMRSSGVLGETLVIVTGDHGMENQNLDRRGLPSDFELLLDEANIDHVMADWHVYLMTMDVASSTEDFDIGQSETTTFTVTDDDTGDPIEGALVTVSGTEGDDISGTTDANGQVVLTLTPDESSVSAVVTHDAFNERTLRFAIKCPRVEELNGNHLIGTAGPDQLTGTAGRDIICGGRGEDVIRALEGNDVILGGNGPDDIDGGSGNDAIRKSRGPDVVHGSNGDDKLRGGLGDDELVGGNGADLSLGGPQNDRIRGLDGPDRLFGERNDDRLNGGPGVDECHGGPDDDTLTSCERFFDRG